MEEEYAYAVLVPSPETGHWEIYSGPFATKEKAEEYARTSWGVPHGPILIMKEVACFERKEDK